MKFIIGVKEGDHGFLFEWVNLSGILEYEYIDEFGTLHHYRLYNDVPLNDSNFDLKVNFLKYYEKNAKGKTQRFSWVTDVHPTEKIVRGDRAR